MVVKLVNAVDVPNVFERIVPVLFADPLPPRFIQLPAPSSFAILIAVLSLTLTPSLVS